MSLALNEENFKSLECGRVNREFQAPVNSCEFSMDGEVLVCSSEDESLRVYSARTGTETRVILSKKYGVDLVRLTDPEGRSAVCASRNTWDHTIRHLSIHSNEYLRYFKGHREKVTSLSLSPRTDGFASASRDATVRFWDLRTANCQGLLHLASTAGPSFAAAGSGSESTRGGGGASSAGNRPLSPCVAYDPDGLVTCVGAGRTVRLYDSRKFAAGPFAVFPTPRGTGEVTGVAFTPDGARVIASCSPGGKGEGPSLLSIDSFDGSVVAEMGGEDIVQGVAPCVAPGGKFVLVGTHDGRASVWEADSGSLVRSFENHAGPVRGVAVNPKYMLVATACTNVALWIPGDSS